MSDKSSDFEWTDTHRDEQWQSKTLRVICDQLHVDCGTN